MRREPGQSACLGTASAPFERLFKLRPTCGRASIDTAVFAGSAALDPADRRISGTGAATNSSVSGRRLTGG